MIEGGWYTTEPMGASSLSEAVLLSSPLKMSLQTVSLKLLLAATPCTAM